MKPTRSPRVLRALPASVLFLALPTLHAVPQRLLPEYISLPGFTVGSSGAFTGRSDLKAGGDFSVSSFGFAVAQEIPAGESGGASVGLSYERIGIDQRGATARTPLPDELLSVGLDFSYERELNADWSLLAGLSPRLANAGSSFTSDGFGLGGLLLATWSYRPDLTFSFGVGFDTLSKSAPVGPAFAFEWTINERWSLLGGYPGTALFYTPSEAWRFGLVAEGTGGSYYVETDPTRGAAGRPALDDSTLEYGDFRLGLSARFQLSKDIAIGAVAGYLLSSEIEYRDPKYKVKSDGGAPYGALTLEATF